MAHKVKWLLVEYASLTALFPSFSERVFFLNVAYFWPQTGDFRAKADEPGYDVMSCKVTRSWRRGSFSPVLNLDHLSEERQAEVSPRTDVAEGEGERETD